MYYIQGSKHTISDLIGSKHLSIRKFYGLLYQKIKSYIYCTVMSDLWDLFYGKGGPFFIPCIIINRDKYLMYTITTK